MKLAMLAAMVVFASSANAAPDHYATSGDVSAQSPCSHSVDLSPSDVGYSVSARQAADHEASTGQSMFSSRSTACGPSSVGYSVSARRAAEQESAPGHVEFLTNGTVLQNSPGFVPEGRTSHAAATTARGYSGYTPALITGAAAYRYSTLTPARAPRYSSPVTVYVPHRYTSPASAYTPYSHSSPTLPATSPVYSGYAVRTGGGGLGSHRVGGTGSSGKGGHYVGGSGRRR